MSTMTSRTNRILLAAAGVLLLACSSSTGSGNAAAFVGTWTYDTGTVTPMNCMVLGQTVPSLDLTGDTVTISQGADSAHIQFVAGTACMINFSLSGDIATATAGQTCTIPVSGVSAVITITAWTLTLSGNSLATSFSGTAPFGTSCTASGTGNLSRPATDASTTDTSAG